MKSKQLVHLVQIFSAKLVLEVFGAAGAIWGCSEATTLRNSDNIGFWRPLALSVGIIFFIRWIFQIRDYIQEQTEFSIVTEAEDEGLTLQEEKSHYDGVSA